MKPLSRIAEAQRIARCVVADDRDAFGRLVENYQPGLRRFLLNLAGDADLADDLAQDSFIKAYLSIRSFRGVSMFKTWLWRIAYNEFLNYTRKMHDVRADFDENPVESDITDTAASSEAKMDVTTLLESLPVNQRTAVLLFYLDDRPIKEIAKIMQVEEGTVKSLLSRARQKMKEID